MKKQGFVILLSLAGLLVSCVTPPTYPDIANNEQAGLLLQRVDTTRAHVNILINGEHIYLEPDEISYMEKGKTYGCGLPNGTYRLSVQLYYSGEEDFVMKTMEPVLFTINNNRVLFRVEVKKTGNMTIGYRGNEVTEYIAVLTNESEGTTGAASAAGTPSIKSGSIEGAVERASGQVLKNVPAKSKIAIVYITAQDRATTDYIAGELEYIWVNEGYYITDRTQVDQLRKEQKFGLSGEVDDKTAVSIGKFAGADIIVTGRVDGEGRLRRLRLRALNTQTAQVVGVTSESF